MGEPAPALPSAEKGSVARALLAEVTSLAAPTGALRCVWQPVPGPRLEGALGALLAAGAALWAPPDEADPSRDAWCFAALGGAAVLSARGEARFTAVRAGLGAALARVRYGASGPPPWGSVRALGGFAFAPGVCDDEVWRGFDDARFELPRWVFAWHPRGDGFVALTLGDEGAPLEREVAQVERALTGARRDAALPRAPGGVAPLRCVSELAPERWERLAGDALLALRDGALEKVVAARRTHLRAPRPLDVARAAAHLRAEQPGCTVFALRAGAATLLGATPETLVEVRAGRVYADALAGTSPRLDAEGLAALLGDPKERREHELVARAVREALAPLCAPGSLAAPREGPSVRALRSLAHLWTPVRGALRAGATVLDAAAALHPTPAVCGAPRAPAAAWIATHEPSSRGWYAAPVGWLGEDGDGCLAVALRCALVRGRDAWLYAGAGLVEGSEPAREYHETAAKQRAMRAALERAA